MKRLVLAFSGMVVIAIGTLTSCSKKHDPAPHTGDDYMPTTAGSHWTYTGAVAYTLTMTGNSKTINGLSYQEGSTTYNGGSSLGYIRKDGGSYYSVGMVSLGVDSLGTDTLEIIILKDNVAKGTSWSETITISDIDYTYKFTIDDKDISHTVNGKSYNQVIKVKLELIFDFLGVPFTIATENIYFAYGVGVIQTEIIPFGSATTSSDLSSFEIK